MLTKPLFESKVTPTDEGYHLIHLICKDVEPDDLTGKVDCITTLRKITGLGWVESKDLIDYYFTE